MKLYVTNTVAAWNQKRNEQTIKLYGRTEDKHLESVEVTGYHPRFYAHSSEIEDNYQTLLSNENVVGVVEDGFESIFGDQLGEIQVRSWNGVKELKELFYETFETDVFLTDRARIEWGLYSGVEVPGRECHYTEVEPCDFVVEPRVVTFDIETDDRGAFPDLGERRILSIVAHDSYTDEYHGFIDLDGRPVEEAFPDGKPAGMGAVHFDSSEKKMLLRFACWFKQTSPDYVLGWNSEDFDVPYLLARMEAVDVNPDRLSPEGYTNLYRGRATIKGVTSYDLLQAYKSTKRGELRSYKLDVVAENELGEKKLDHTGESIWDMYQNDCDKLLRYNSKDVRLTVEVNREAGVLDFKQTLRHEVGVELENTTANNEFIEMMVRRKLFERGVIAPDAKYEPKDKKYEGAFVFEPYTGVTSNVVGIDLSSLYPYTMAMLNASPETKTTAIGAGMPVARAPNGARFQLMDDGVFKELIDDAIGLKSEYKKLRNSAEPGTDEHAEYAEKYHVSKTITNSIYGVAGWERFFLYDEDVAEAVTTMGQAVIKATQRYINEETVGEVIYGDTDSNYARFPPEWGKEKCLAEANKIADELNKSVYPDLAEQHGIPGEENLWDIEVEAYMESYFQAGKKKRYAYICTWVDGQDCEPKVSIKGFDTERSDTPMLTKELQETILKMILEGATELELGEVVHEAASSITPTDVDWNAIGIPAGLGKELRDYAWTDGTPKGAHPRGAFFTNEISGTNFGAGDKPKRVYVQPYTPEIDGWSHGTVDVLAFDEPAELPDDVVPDCGRMTQTLVTKPMRRILNAVGVDVDAATKGQTQTGLGAFL